MPRRAGYFHLSGAEHFAIPLIAASVNLEHGALGNIVRLFPIDSVHSPGVEKFALAADFPHVEFAECLIETFNPQFVTFLQSGQGSVFRAGRGFGKQTRQPALARTRFIAGTGPMPM